MDNMDSIFYDETNVLIDEIADRLYSGHAAVMIGAGFSKNAASDDLNAFPSWDALGDKFYEKLYGYKPEESRYLDVLKLAEEVEAVFGRTVLNQFLTDNIPDLKYEPSLLHSKLLELPWVDVFTTNYDTLLERACKVKPWNKVKYDIVTTTEDLQNADNPRIIKLHGSFPTIRPFIITEEDYRKYPKKFEPFVNTVQQSLLENTLCLIGFSANDPNFLQWIGWLRDNFTSEYSPKIYLVTASRPTHSQYKLFEKRNIVVVDLSQQVRTNTNVSNFHYKALEYFLKKLKYKKPYNYNWPKEYHQKEELKELIPLWKKDRENYPGWCILPHNLREKLLTFTELHRFISSDEKKFPIPTDIKFMYELVWRLERCLYPLHHYEAEFIKKLLKKYLPFETLLNHKKEVVVCYDDKKYESLPWDDIKNAWIYLSFSLLRYFREKGKHNEWKKIKNKIEKIEGYLSAEQRARFYYECVLQDLFTFIVPDIEKTLNKWKKDETLPFWEAKRAGVLAELGRIEEAQSILEQSLNTIRLKINLKPTKDDLSLVSQEAYILWSFRKVSFSVRAKQGNYGDKNSSNIENHWNQFKIFGIDPEIENLLFSQALTREATIYREKIEKTDFDIGVIKSSYHWDIRGDKDYILAKQFLRFIEEIGSPFKVPMVNFAIREGNGVCKRIYKYNPYLAFIVQLRCGDRKNIDDFFSRSFFNQFDQKQTDLQIEFILDILEKNQTEIRDGNTYDKPNFGILFAQIGSDILSRLCSKASLSKKDQLLYFLQTIYLSNQKNKYAGIKNLVRRLIESYNPYELWKRIPKLLSFPILDNLSDMAKDEFMNPFYFVTFDKDLLKDWARSEFAEIQINELIKYTDSGNANGRAWAIISLAKLHEYGLLTEEQNNNFAKALWSKVDNNGLPENMDFYKFVLLTLPSPKETFVNDLVKNYVLKLPLPTTNGNKSYTGTRGKIEFCDELIGLGDKQIWSIKDIKGILDRLVEWWDADKEELRNEENKKIMLFGSRYDEFKARFCALIRVLFYMIIPNLDQIVDAKTKRTLSKLIKELEIYELHNVQLKVAALNIFPEWKEEIVTEITNNIASNDEETININLHAGLVLLKKLNIDFSKSKLEGLISFVAQAVCWRRKLALSSSMHFVTEAIKIRPDLLNESAQRLVLQGLEYLAKETSPQNDTTVKEEADKLLIRQNSARLAYALYSYFLEREQDISEEINVWKQICQDTNEFSEVRNQWPRY
ncbi:MAG: SIR2 family protein [Alphaproteobacteria bacterium]